jgi:antitoxin PrlF
MTAPVEHESTLTDRYQTTVPAAVRKALKLGKRDKLVYRVRDNGEVVLARLDQEEDPALGPFLALLERDMRDRPDVISPLDADLLERARELVSGVEVDLDAPLDHRP